VLHDVGVTQLQPCPDGPTPAAASVDHPRPQLVRKTWSDLSGLWDFALDEGDVGLHEQWFAPGPLADAAFARKIVVPYPPESAASGIGDTGFHPIVWYRTSLEPLPAAQPGSRQILHFGAVDYRAQVWLAGQYLGGHEGGSSPFSFDVTELLDPTTSAAVLVVRVEDDPLDASQPRGKQDWRLRPHGIWYHRTTGIWQTVWLETAPMLHARRVDWSPDIHAGTVTLSLELSERPKTPVTVEVRLRFGDEALSTLSFEQSEPRSSTVITIAPRANSLDREGLLWSPEHPRLIDAEVRICAPESEDVVLSYFGLRSVDWSAGHFLLNDQPYYLRAVLEQGYWPQTHLAAPDSEALRGEVELIKELGFNAARIHQKVEDPRFLYWADRLGLLVWAECPSAYEFSTVAIERTVREWAEVIMRDRSHPSVVTWVPANESWGVREVAHDPAQLDYIRALYHLTRALDPTRPVVSNDGWEHAESDIITIHDYGTTPAELAANYENKNTVMQLLSGTGPLGRRMQLLDHPYRGQPIVVSEFGGIGFNTSPDDSTWGYGTAANVADFEDALRSIFTAVQASPVLAGFCYTQLTDTLREVNGLTDAERVPKLAPDIIRSIVLGEGVDAGAHQRPKRPLEVPNAPSGSHSEPNHEGPAVAAASDG
jgi:beta-galactosidase/beta-glucuronidase